MPDVTRTDSNRSDTKPRVSFNRDVHVKRIVPTRSGGDVTTSTKNSRTLATSPIRKERVKRSKKELEEEAAKIVQQAETLDCVTHGGNLPDKFYTLPHRKKPKPNATPSPVRRGSLELTSPPKKPPRTFVANNKPSIFDVFKKEKPPKKSNLRRSVSDATNLKSKRNILASENEEKCNKKQLSPIVEVTQREDYFTKNDQPNKPSVTEQLKQYIDEVDAELYKETGIRITTPNDDSTDSPRPIIIDLDKAEKISSGKKSKFKSSSIGKRIKSITNKKKHEQQETIEDLKQSPKMIHSSQKPPEKPPLTKGRTVDHIVKRLSNDSISPLPPPLTSSVLITPSVAVAHNHNQPFSYTRGLSPEKCEPSSPVIYAQVVCGNNSNKQTVHTMYSNGKKHPNSDSDEGLGGEEHNFKSITHFGETEEYFEEKESPILPKFRSRNVYYPPERGRGDGMDSKRRDNVLEVSRTDLSARRDLLESRINRRINDNTLRTSPNSNIVYIVDSTPKYHTSKITQNNVTKVNGYSYDTSEPKSLDSQLSDYRSSPEHTNVFNSHSSHQQSSNKISKNRGMYKSTPEIHQSTNYTFQDSYHDSLRRDKDIMLSSSKFKSERYLLDHHDDRKDRFVDSGIENDFSRRDSSENYRKPHKSRRDYMNDSEDEGFASSLLIASERQHTEDNLGRKNRKEYDSDRTNSREDDHSYNNVNSRHVESMNYANKARYVPRERSIDDGSHYDPRIDRDTDRSTLKRMELKPPKPEKKSSLEKVKSLFTSKKKKEKPEMVKEETLRARYIEYKGREPTVERPLRKKEIERNYEYNLRRRLSTPSPSPPRPSTRTGAKSTTTTTTSTSGSWFKSLDRLSRKKNEREREANFTSTEDEQTPSKPTPTKNLRFFGDTDAESGDSVRQKSSKLRPGLFIGNGRSTGRSQSTRDLHNISEEDMHNHIVRNVNAPHQSMTNIICDSDRDIKGSRSSLKPPVSPSRRPPRDVVARQHRDREESNKSRMRRKNEVSSVESSTEGDSSQQSQRSVVYLHAATVGDIPGPGYLRNGRRAASREELASNSSSRLQPQTKTLSRSFSVLAPWRPRHYREAMDIDYTQYPKKNSKYEQKSENTNNRKQSSTLKKKAQESRKNNASSTTLNRRSRSKESLSQNNNSTLVRKSRDELNSKGSTSTLYKKKESRLPREHARYSSANSRGDDNNKKISSKSLSVESLGHGPRDRDDITSNNSHNKQRDVSRSVSMPRDPEKSAGWFKLGRKSKNGSTQRLG